MTWGRRSFLKAFAASPLAARAAAEKVAAELSGISQGVGYGSGEVGGMSTSAPSHPPPSVLNESTIRSALASAVARAEIESIFYEEGRHVSRIDYDLASKRSFSLAAKIAFQRQRNIARRMHDFANDGHTYWYTRVTEIVRKALIGI